MSIILTLILILCGSSESFASFGSLKIHRTNQQFCYSPLEAPSTTTCLNIISSTPIKIPVAGQIRNFTKLQIEELALDPNDKEANKQNLEVTLSWEGKGAGLLAITGPQGKMFVFGTLTKDPSNREKPYSVKIETFTDESLTQQFDRETVFGETDPLRLDTLTQMWLEQALIPTLEKYFNEKMKTIEIPAK